MMYGIVEGITRVFYMARKSPNFYFLFREEKECKRVKYGRRALKLARVHLLLANECQLAGSDVFQREMRFNFNKVELVLNSTIILCF